MQSLFWLLHFSLKFVTDKMLHYHSMWSCFSSWRRTGYFTIVIVVWEDCCERKDDLVDSRIYFAHQSWGSMKSVWWFPVPFLLTHNLHQICNEKRLQNVIFVTYLPFFLVSIASWQCLWLNPWRFWQSLSGLSVEEQIFWRWHDKTSCSESQLHSEVHRQQ